MRLPVTCTLFLASTLTLMGQSTDAASASARAHLNTALHLLQQNHPDQAIPELEQSVTDDPGLADAQANLGVLYYFHHDYEKSLPHLSAAVSLKPEVAKLRALLGLSEVKMHQRDKGYADLHQALPNLRGEKIQREVGEMLMQMDAAKGDTEDAVYVVSLLLESNPADPQLLLTSYQMHSQLANNAIVTLALAAPESAELHMAMAQELALHGQDDNAIANYHDALRLKPSIPGAHFALGNVYYNSSDAKQQQLAAAEYAAAIQQNPQDEAAWRMQGKDAARRGEMKTAVTALERALQLQPDDVEVCTELAKFRVDEKDPVRAEELLRHAIAVDPTNEIAYYRLALLYRQLGRADEAKREITSYQKIRETKNHLRDAFREMRIKLDEKEAPDGEASK